MIPLTPGPGLDARIAKWMGWHLDKHSLMWVNSYGSDIMWIDQWKPSTKATCYTEVLDALVERGYEPALVYHPEDKTWAVAFGGTWDEEEETDGGPLCYSIVIDNHLWQPTRPLAISAAVVELMGEDDE